MNTTIRIIIFLIFLLFSSSILAQEVYFISNTEFSGTQPNGISYNSNNLYIALNQTNQIVKFDLYSKLVSNIAGTGFPGEGLENEIAITSPLNFPTIAKVASDGTIYIVDSANNRIRKVDGDELISTVSSMIAFNQPFGLDIHPITGDLYITELTVGIVKLTPGTGIVEELTLHGSGYNGDEIPANQAQVNNPLQIHVKSNGEYYFVDYGNSAIRKVDIYGNISTLVWGSYTAIGGNQWVSDEFYFGGFGEVFKYSNGSYFRIAGGGMLDSDNVEATSVSLGSINGIDLGPSGEIYISEFEFGRIRKLVSCPPGTSYSILSHSCVSCNCSGRGECIDNNLCNCTTYGWSGSNCHVPSCFNIPSDQVFNVCSGFGICISVDNCTCGEGHVGIDCSINTNTFEVWTNFLSANLNESDVIEIELFSGGVLPTFYMWSCTNCFFKNPSNPIPFYNTSNILIVDASLLHVGTHSFTVFAIYDNGPFYPPRISNTEVVQVTVSSSWNPVVVSPQLEIFGLPSVLVDRNSTLTNLNIIIPRLTMEQSQINQFLSLCAEGMSGNSTCGDSLAISYIGSISVITTPGNYLRVASYSGNTIGRTNFNNTVTFSPSLNFKNSHSFSGSEMIFDLILVGSTNLTFSVSVPILSSAKPPTSSINSTVDGSVIVDTLGTVSPSTGVALSNTFSINFALWTAPSQLLPLKYSVGFFDPVSSNLVRITDYSESTSTNFILPFISSSASNNGELTVSPLNLVVFVSDSLGNEYSSIFGSVASISPFTGTSSQLIDLINSFTNSPLLTVFSYDSSFSTNSSSASDIALEIVKNVVIDPKNPTTALTTLQQATLNPDAVDARVIAELTTKINNFIVSLNSIYKEDRDQFGFVKSKLSNVDTTSTTSIISNVLASGRGNEQSKGMADNLTNLLILGEIPTLLISQEQSTGIEELTGISFGASRLDISVAVFQMDEEMTGTNHIIRGGGGVGDNSVTLSLSEIMKQYNGYSKESAASMVTYDTNIYTNPNASVLASNLTDFKYYQNQQVVRLNNLTNDIVLNFKITNSTIVTEKIMEYLNNNTTQFNSTLENQQSNTTLSMVCKYWDETSLIWSSKGCYLKSLNLTSREILCSCSHTTMFTTFVEQNTSSISALLRDTVAAFYFGQIALGIFYFLSAIVILCLLVIFKNEQPISSRLITPYLGMIALIVESLLVYITQRGILVRQLTSSPTQMWESGDTDANTIANIVLIFANTINLTAILSYVMQVLRFQVMKYLYDLLASSRTDEKKSDRILQTLRFLTSSSLFSVILIGFALINVCYWVLWVILRRTGVLYPTTYTYIVSISYTAIIFTFGAIITCVAIFDWAGSTLKQGQKKRRRKSTLTRESKFKIEEKIQKEMEKFGLFEKIYNILVGIDEPLYFRTEMIIYVISFIFLILNQVIGLVGNEYRYGNESSYKKALLFDSISFIFEVLYIFTYLFVFGGYSLILLLIHKIKTWRGKKQQTNPKTNINKGREINEEMTLVFSNEEATEMFANFCVKEFSSENFYLYSDLKENSDIIEGTNIPKLNPYLKYIHETYMKDGANYQVNIPNKCRTSFMKIFNKYVANQVLELLSSSSPPVNDNKENETIHIEEVKTTFEMLIQQVFVNLGDTFSRFVFSVEFKIFKKAHDLQKEILKEANVVFSIDQLPPPPSSSEDIELE